MQWFVYVLQSTVDGNLYTGLSRNPEKRLLEHNQGKTRSTRHRRPFILLFYDTFNTRVEARKREKYLKSGVGREYIKKIHRRT
jgi:putative endonuclease